MPSRARTPLVVALLSLLGLAPLVVGGRPAAFALAAAAGLLPAALMSLGIGPGRARRPLHLAAWSLGVWNALVLVALIGLAGQPKPALVAGAPAPALLAVVGLGLAPLLPAGLAFALGFRRFVGRRRPQPPGPEGS